MASASSKRTFAAGRVRLQIRASGGLLLGCEEVCVDWIGELNAREKAKKDEVTSRSISNGPQARQASRSPTRAFVISLRVESAILEIERDIRKRGK